MPYVHGVTTTEKPTAILPPVTSDAGIPFVVGMAPVNMTDPTNVNKPVLYTVLNGLNKEIYYVT